MQPGAALALQQRGLAGGLLSEALCGHRAAVCGLFPSLPGRPRPGPEGRQGSPPAFAPRVQCSGGARGQHCLKHRGLLGAGETLNIPGPTGPTGVSQARGAGGEEAGSTFCARSWATRRAHHMHARVQRQGPGLFTDRRAEARGRHLIPSAQSHRPAKQHITSQPTNLSPATQPTPVSQATPHPPGGHRPPGLWVSAEWPQCPESQVPLSPGHVEAEVRALTAGSVLITGD